jgi:hypothetical protein
MRFGMERISVAYSLPVIHQLIFSGLSLFILSYILTNVILLRSISGGPESVKLYIAANLHIANPPTIPTIKVKKNNQ